MKTLKRFLETSLQELPREPWARWASVFLTLSVLAAIFSIAISQACLAVSGLIYLAGWIRRRRPINFPPIGWPVLLFCLLTVLATIWAANPAAGAFAIRKLVLFLIILLSLNLIVSLKHLEWLYGGLFVASAVAGVVSAVQFVAQYHAMRARYPHGFYAHMVGSRITGFQGDWMNFSGQQMLVWLMLAAFLFLRRRSRGDEKKNVIGEKANPESGQGKRPMWRASVWWIAGIVITVSIILSFTRGVWLGCFVAGLYVVARWKARVLWAAPVLVLLIVLFAPRLVRERLASVLHPRQDASIATRFEMWHAGLRMIARHPWLGVGPSNINQVYDLYLPPGKPPHVGYHGHLHSDYIQFAAARGLPCLGAWLWLMGILGWQALKIRRRSRRGRWIADGAFAAWLAFMVEGVFEFNFGTSPVLMVFLFVATTPFIVERLEASRAATTQNP